MNDTPAARQVNEGTFYVAASMTVLLALMMTVESAQKEKFTVGLVVAWLMALLLTSTGVLSWRTNRKDARQDTSPSPSIGVSKRRSPPKGVLICVTACAVCSLLSGWGIAEIFFGLSSPATPWPLKVVGVNLLVACVSVQAWWLTKVAAYVGETRRAREGEQG